MYREKYEAYMAHRVWVWIVKDIGVCGEGLKMGWVCYGLEKDAKS